MSYSNLEHLKEIKNKNVFFFDLETTGLVKTKTNVEPENQYPDYKELKIYDNARIVSIGWIYIENFNYEQEIIFDNINNCIIKPNNFIIPKEAIAIHKITNEIANNKGSDIKEILKKIGKKIRKCDYIIGYNVFYDVNILLSELYRIGKNKTINKILDLKENKNILCIGQISYKNLIFTQKTQIFKYQIHKLIDVYLNCFNENYINAHNAKSDVFCMIKILYWLYKNKIELNINKNIKEKIQEKI